MLTRRFLFLSFSLIFLTIVLHGFSQRKRDPNKCGTWRWDIKTLTDNNGPALLTKRPIQSSIDQLVIERPQKVLYDNSRSDGLTQRYPSEDQVVVIEAYVVKMKYEQDDHDLHLILRSIDSDKTMVGEIPDPSCSTFDAFPSLRNCFTQTRSEGYEVWDQLKRTHSMIKVRITGVPFWDGAHSQRPTGASEYFREIHPILKLEMKH